MPHALERAGLKLQFTINQISIRTLRVLISGYNVLVTTLYVNLPNTLKYQKLNRKKKKKRNSV